MRFTNVCINKISTFKHFLIIFHLYLNGLHRYGSQDSPAFRRAQRNFIVSLAASSVATYILQVKDRHNGNVMIDDDGHILHIDFGFIFETSPAGNMRFESANFKLTLEMVQVCPFHLTKSMS